MDELLPVLVTRLANAEARDWLAQIALASGVALLALTDAPIDATLHVLEAHVPGGAEPLVFLAEPEGPPNDLGLFPLRVRPLNERQAASFRPTQSNMPSPASPRSFEEGVAPEEPKADRSAGLSKRHAKDLSSVAMRAAPALDAEELDEDILGRSLAGGKYTILELVGTGGAGSVYKARHRELRKIVAVKVMHPSYQRDIDFCARFYGEALAASKLDHPNVMRVLDYGQEADGLLYIAMEFLAGQNLQSIIDKEGALPVERIASIMMQVCAALTMAHEHGIVHRDIKPDNIVLVPGKNDDGVAIELVKVCDFGIAQRRDGTSRALPERGQHLDEGSGTRDADGTSAALSAAWSKPADGTSEAPPQRGQPLERLIAGTPQYMSPEQGRGDDLDERSDIYSCGVVLYELATGRVPFDDHNAMIIIVKHITQAPLPPSALSPDVDPLLESIILKALRKEPAERHQTARELRGEIRELLAPVMLSRHPSSMLPHARGRREVLDASALPPLGADASGFAEFFLSLSSALLRTGCFDRGHAELGLAFMRLTQSADHALKHRGEITLAAASEAWPGDFVVMTGAGEVSELSRVVSSPMHSQAGGRLATLLAAKGVVALTIGDGVEATELARVVDVLSGDLDADGASEQLDILALPHIKVLFASNMLGQERRLAPEIDLCLSRLARELRAIAAQHAGEVETLRPLSAQLVGDIMRVLARPTQAKLALVHADLVAKQIADIAVLESFDPLAAIVDALPRARCLQIVPLVIADFERERDAQDPTGMSARVAKGATPRRILYAFGDRFVRDRSVESDEVLRELNQNGILPLTDLPSDLQNWFFAEQRAELLILDPPRVLEPLDAILASDDTARLQLEVASLERLLATLARRGEAGALWAVVSRLLTLARGTSESAPVTSRGQALAGRRDIAVRTLRSLEDAARLAPIAEALLSRHAQMHEPAHFILVHAGSAGAHALYAARARPAPATATMNPAGRARFVCAMREIALVAWPALLAAIEHALPPSPDGPPAPAAFDPLLAEDLLLAVPPVEDEKAGNVVAKFVKLGGPLCAAAVTALVSLWGARARPLLVGVLGNADDAVRIAALTALRSVGGIDDNVVVRIDRILVRAVAAGDELRAACAAALADATPAARPAASAALKRALSQKITGAAAARPELPAVVLSLARSLFAIGGPEAESILRTRAAVSDEPLRKQLLAILR